MIEYGRNCSDGRGDEGGEAGCRKGKYLTTTERIPLKAPRSIPLVQVVQDKDPYLVVLNS